MNFHFPTFSHIAATLALLVYLLLDLDSIEFEKSIINVPARKMNVHCEHLGIRPHANLAVEWIWLGSSLITHSKMCHLGALNRPGTFSKMMDLGLASKSIS
jgi:hypothetical protein